MQLNEQLTLQCEDLKKQLAGERQAIEGLKKEVQILKDAALEKEAAVALVEDQIHQNKTEIVVKHREMSRLLEVCPLFSSFPVHRRLKINKK